MAPNETINNTDDIDFLNTDGIELPGADDTDSPDFDGFLSKPPYLYGWTKNANGVKVPVFPYVISILGHLNLQELGVSSEYVTQARELLKKTLNRYLKQVIKQWEAKSPYGGEDDKFPLIILMNIADKFGGLVTEVVKDLQEQYKFVRLIAVLPMPKDKFIQQLEKEEGIVESAEEFEKRYNEFNNENDVKKHIWELSEREMPHIEGQEKSIKWRIYNEFVAQHSHLMIVFWQGQDEKEYEEEGKKDDSEELEDSLDWVVRYKLEGYPGLSRHGQTDLITHPAIGPVLHIKTNQKTLTESKEYLPAYFYSDRATITKEENGKRDLIINDSRFWDLEKIRHTWLDKIYAYSDIGHRSEIKINCQILKDLNCACQDKRAREFTKGHKVQKIQEKNKPLRSTFRDFVIQKYKESHKELKEEIPEIDEPTGQYIAHYSILKQLGEFYREKTYRLINVFCGTFLILFFFTTLLLYLNNISIMSFGKNALGLSYYCVTGMYHTEQLADEGHLGEKSEALLKLFLPQTTPDAKLNESIHAEFTNVTRIIVIFFFSSLAVLGCIVSIFCCCISLMRNKWHYKYHQIRTLVDCLEVQIFWKIAGLDYNVSANFRSHQMPALDWLLMVLNGLNVTIPNSEKIESMEQLKERFRVLDTIWIEDYIRQFDVIFKTNFWSFVYDRLILFSKAAFWGVSAATLFLFAFFIADIGAGCGFWKSIFIALQSTIVTGLLLGLYFFISSIRDRVDENAKLKKYEDKYDKFSGFIGNIYRAIKPKPITKNYFRVPILLTISQAFIIIIACSGVFFEFWRIKSIYEAAQSPAVQNLHSSMMAFRLLLHLVLSIMAIGWLYTHMGLFAKSRRRIEQLYYPFEIVDYSIDMMLVDKKAVENIHSSIRRVLFFWLSPEQSRQVSTDSDEGSDKEKVQLCQQIILELGQEILAKRVDWLLAYSDRDLQSPKSS